IPAAGPFPYLTSVIPDISGATAIGDPPVPSCQASVSDSIWYSFTPALTANYTVQDCSTGPTATTVVDTVIAIYTSSDSTCSGVMTQVAGACNDNGCASQSTISTVLTAGIKYFVLAYKFGAAPPLAGQTAVQLRITAAFPPSNDTCAAPTVLPMNTTVVGTLAAATNNFQVSTVAPNCYALPALPTPPIGQTTTAATGRDVVYSFTAPSVGSYSFRAQELVAGGNLVLGVGASCPGGAGPTTPIDCLGAANRTSSSSAFSAAEEVMCVPLLLGQQVFVFVDESALSATGGDFMIEATPCIRELEANGTPATANPIACGIEGSLTPAGDVDFFSIGSPVAGSRVFAMADGVYGSSTDFDMRVTTVTDTLEYDDAGNSTPWGSLAPNIDGRALTGVASFIRMNHFSAASTSEPYRLFSAIQPPGAGLGASSATAEVEPNGALATASVSGSLFFSGTIAPPGGAAGDLDLFRFCADAGDLIFLGIDGDPLRDLTPLDATPFLFDNLGVQVVTSGFVDSGSSSNNTSGAGSLVASNPNSPGDAMLYRAKYTGTYYAGINTQGAGATATGDYLYSIALNCQTGSQLLANLSATIADAPDPVNAGSNIAYTINIANAGKTALDATWTVPLPANTALVSVTGPAGWSCLGGAAIVCTTSCFSPGAPGTFVLTLATNTCTPAGVLSTTVTVSSRTPDPDNSDNTATAMTTVIGCDDGNLCTTDTCDMIAGCVHVATICSASDQCHAAGVCNPGTGMCSNPNAANGLACNDGSACTQSDTCQAGLCTGGNPVVCAALDQCHGVGVCDGVTGLCSNPNAADGMACNDGSACTQSDTCVAGVCTGANPVVCAASDQCHGVGVCNAATGACSNPNLVDGTGCNDGSSCTQSDTCVAGTCTGANPVVCAASDQCHDAGTCQPDAGFCTNPNASDGTGCIDTSLCTTADRCLSGACTGTPVICPPLGQCYAAGTCQSGT
ncbi:MAG: hypothetical protein ABI193_17600, partial [Minicystis sp.]